MNLYLVEQDKNNNYDTYDSFVCRAVDENIAKIMSPCEYYIWENDAWHFVYYDKTKRKEEKRSDWVHPDHVSVTLLGTAAEDTQGVVLASYNAG